MNREILFRGKRVDNGEWIESLTLLKLNEHLYMFQTAWGEITYDLQHNITAILGRKKPFLVEVIPETVGRYTGLTDKNGRRIFEGDIVSAHGYSGYVAMDTDYWEIHWNHNFNRQLYLWHDVVEVIGNIHDNPELLKGEK